MSDCKLKADNHKWSAKMATTFISVDKIRNTISSVKVGIFSKMRVDWVGGICCLVIPPELSKGVFPIAAHTMSSQHELRLVPQKVPTPFLKSNHWPVDSATAEWFPHSDLNVTHIYFDRQCGSWRPFDQPGQISTCILLASVSSSNLQ